MKLSGGNQDAARRSENSPTHKRDDEELLRRLRDREEEIRDLELKIDDINNRFNEKLEYERKDK
eukprot:CAMPEP_0114593870 /NCGR_PEP_ID=MMETSP0125-20121206/15465_1 /TAXON_ID=485358 ORGANISM="Aristerostoma sp., Strain ATCC 50986" /NCGR_SAMPLE_ID=MMETSP0125 /ASSEMBLY_ACC=CAM_ASM_000245 /LENGTH=63 /DNA_ID=CAMNT_0001793483 /DNA_START=128 /DNA_END=319 /DNA_ORIENTATION=+